MYDVIVIGAGIVGNAISRELSKYKLNILVLDKEDDLSCGATKANSGIVHAGFDCKPGTLKAHLNVKGTKMYETLTKDLDIPYRNNGSLVVGFHENDMDGLKELYERGIKNSVPKLKLLKSEEVLNIEPNLSSEVIGALYAETAGVISPYEASNAFAENAFINGANYIFNTEVKGIEKLNEFYNIKTNNGNFYSKTVVNAAGLYSDVINNYISPKKEEVYPQRGEYYLIDNAHAGFVEKTIFQLPTKLGKGVLIAPTVDRNILIGPNSERINDKEDTDTTLNGLNEVFEKASITSEKIPIWDRITEFSGLRSKTKEDDFVINEPEEGFFNALGIDSPGISSAPAIGEMIANMVVKYLNPEENVDFIKTRASIKRFKDLDFHSKEELIKNNKNYGNVICRCETITEGEIIEAINRPLGARSLDGIKRRTRAQMGRCQGGFCTIRLIEILSRELNITEMDVTKFGKHSNLLKAMIKDEL